jgi:membrane fusion protein, multidrug efflux system
MIVRDGRVLRSLVAAFLLGSASMVAAGCAHEASGAPPPPAPPEVDVAQVLTRRARQWDELTGRISSVDSVDLRARVSGYVERVAFEEGQEVKKGDVLFVIDSRRLRAQLVSASAELERARSAGQLAHIQDRRMQKLVEAQAATVEEADTRRSAVEQSAASVRAAEGAIAAMQLELQYSQVRAPISGRAGRALVTVGNLVQADTTVLTTVVSQDPVHVYFDADEQAFLRYAALERSGQRAASNNPVRVGLANEQGYPHQGTVDFVDNHLDPATGTVRARAVLDNKARVFTPGLFARVQLEGAPESEVMLVSDRAILTDQSRKYVYVLGPDNKAQRKDVVLGRVVDGLRVVTSGLSADDKVIVEGVQRVFMPGMPVAPHEVAMDRAPDAGAGATAP